MTGDFSRWRAGNARRQGYSGVLMQQGRLYTDSDWNENLAILNDRAEDLSVKTLGASGTSKEAPGFAIAQGAGGFSIGEGAYWVDGLRVENIAVTSYAAQGENFAPEPSLASIPDGSELLIYLEVSKDEVSALVDPLLADPALSGVDTAVRERARWRVGIRPVTLSDEGRQTLIKQSRCGHLPDFADWRPGTGRMRAGTAPAPDLAEDECMLAPDSGYLSQENQLYRVEIVRGGALSAARFVWSRENASVEARLLRNDDGSFKLEGAKNDEALGFRTGDFVEVRDDRDVALGRPGFFTRIALADGIATFTPALADFAQMRNPLVRRWDHQGSADGLALAATPIALERGIEVSFTNGSYIVGDAWMFEARAAIGKVVWPPYPGAVDEAVPPMTWGKRRALLALAHRAGAGITGLVDLRAKFPALTCLKAEDIRVDSSDCPIEADTVQDMLDFLCQQQSGGLCTVVVKTSAQLVAAVRSFTTGQSVRLCLTGSTFALDETLHFTNLGHLVVEGTGPQTVISVAKGEAAFLFDGCASVQVRDLSVNGGPNKVGGPKDVVGLTRGRHGALTMLRCGDVVVERVRARCRNGLDRASSCISSIGSLGRYQEVRIRDCSLKAGQAQIGIQITGASRTIIEDNHIRPLPAPVHNVRARIGTDRAQRARIVRSVLRFSAASETPSPMLNVSATSQPYSYGPIERSSSISEAELDFNSTEVIISSRNHEQVRLRVQRILASSISAGVRNNRASSLILTAAELRRYVRNLMINAIANYTGSGLLPDKNFTLAGRPFLAQGIVVGGDQIDEAQIRGNRIEDAIDGIRVAASGRGDPKSPSWRDAPPPNHAEHVLIDGNTITLNPLSSSTYAHGIFLGHVARTSVHRNSVTMSGRQWPEAPHFGIRQYGWRGALLTMTENQVVGMANGIVVAGHINSRMWGLWRLRDNAFSTARAYVVTDGVDVIP